jgi:hypothetical protein
MAILSWIGWLLAAFAGWLRRWATAHERPGFEATSGTREARVIRVKKPGDANLSSLLNVLVLAGLGLLRLP